MGAWDDGPFDNDSAADWCGGLHDAEPSERAGLIRDALMTAASNEDYLDIDDASPAIAAAAIVAAGLPGGTPITSPYAPDFLLAGESLPLDADLAQLAIRALDRIVGENSEWRALWGEDGDESFPVIEQLQAVLAAGS